MFFRALTSSARAAAAASLRSASSSSSSLSTATTRLSAPTCRLFSTTLSSSAPNKTMIIGIAGGSASGKTTLCKRVAFPAFPCILSLSPSYSLLCWVNQLHDKLSPKYRVAIVTQDHFYRDLTPHDHVLAASELYNFDAPDAFDHDQVFSVLSQLREGKQVIIPRWDYKTHSHHSGDTETIPASDVILYEGILTLHDERARNLMDMKIFVDTDADFRLSRRVLRDIAERGRDLKMVLNQYERTVKPSFEKFILPTKQYADIVIPWDRDNHVAVDLLYKHLKTYLDGHH